MRICSRVERAEMRQKEAKKKKKILSQLLFNLLNYGSVSKWRVSTNRLHRKKRQKSLTKAALTWKKGGSCFSCREKFDRLDLCLIHNLLIYFWFMVGSYLIHVWFMFNLYATQQRTGRGKAKGKSKVFVGDWSGARPLFGMICAIARMNIKQMKAWEKKSSAQDLSRGFWKKGHDLTSDL